MTVRLPADLHRKLVRHAATEFSSVNRETVNAIRALLEAHKPKGER
jgi:hypothetical protein